MREKGGISSGNRVGRRGEERGRKQEGQTWPQIYNFIHNKRSTFKLLLKSLYKDPQT